MPNGDPTLNAFITVLEHDALEQARAADAELSRGTARSPLHGIPISVTDIVDIAGVPTTAASRLRRGHRAESDAAVVARLRAAGAIFIGKCNLHEFAFGTTGEDSAYGPTRNPHAPERVSGGSSSGSAVSVATGMALASIGTDTGGSIRIPSCACGVVGLKPTHGDVSCDGIVPLAPSLDHVGPIATTVEDARLVYRAMCGAADAAREAPARRVDPPRLGVPRRYFLDVIEPAVLDAFEQTVDRLRGAGCAVDVVEIPHAGDTGAVYLHTQLPEASAYHANALETRPTEYTQSVRSRLELGRYVLAEDYVRAQRGRKVLTGEVDAALAGHTALLLPTLPIAPPLLGTDTVAVGGVRESVRALMLRLTQLFDVTGHPAVSIPCGTRDGLPVGVQLVGRRGETERLLALAMRHEAVIRS